MRLLNLVFDDRETVAEKNVLMLTDKEFTILFMPVLFYKRNNELKRRALEWLKASLQKNEQEILKSVKLGRLP